MIELVTILEWSAFSASLICSWVYGYRTVWGPIIGIVTAILFIAFGLVSGIYAAAAANIIFLAIHLRNGIKMIKDNPAFIGNKTQKDVNDLVYKPANSGDAEGAVTRLANACHKASADAGWWTDIETGQKLPANVLLKLVLIHSEVSEAMEGDRKDLQDDKLPHRKMFEVELADAVIRIADLGGRLTKEFGGYFVGIDDRDIYRKATGDVAQDLCRIHYHASQVYIYYSNNAHIKDAMLDRRVCEQLAILLQVVFQTAEAHALDLGGAIAEKMEYNAVRLDHKIENRVKGGGKRY